MAWFGLDKLLLGVDLTAEQQRSNAADAQLAQLHQQELDAGLLTQAQYDAAQADIAAGNASTGDDNVTASVNSEAAAGAKQGLDNAMNAPGKFLGFIGDEASKALKSIAINIPWWVYVGAAIAIFVWMGGLSLLRGRLDRK